MENRPDKTVILTKSFGSNSNILFQNLHFEAFCMRRNIIFVNPFLKKYAEVFPRLKETVHLKYEFSTIQLVLKSLIAINFDVENTLENDRQHLIGHERRMSWVKGWGFRAHEDTAKERRYFQNVYRPVGSELINQEHNEWRKKGELLSVHIRRGDYKTWCGGRYYYEDTVYVDQIRKALKLNPNIAKILIFSNEPIEKAEYLKIGMEVEFPNGRWYEDQWRMAESDWILGPPSTFSAWASYIGEVPLWHVSDPDADIDFKICTG